MSWEDFHTLHVLLPQDLWKSALILELLAQKQRLQNNFGEEVYNSNNAIIFLEGYSDLGNKILKPTEPSKNKRISDHGAMKFTTFKRLLWLFLLAAKLSVEATKV